MKVKVMASGSSGNCTMLDGKLMIDAGIPMKQILTALNYKLPEYVLITHEHGDHAKVLTIESLLERGVEMYMTEGTKDALKLENRYNLHVFSVGDEVSFGNYRVNSVKAVHDAAEPAIFKIESDTEKILYAIDTGQLPIDKTLYTEIFVEANYSEKVLETSLIDERQRRRIFENHLSIERLIDALKNYRLEKLREVHFLHLSRRHANVEKFVRAVKEVVGEVEVYAH